jgi:hypothetical protein
MQIVIDIDEEDWKDINDIHFIREDLKFKIGKAIMKGKLLPELHGRLIDADAIPRHLVRDIDEIDKQPTIIEGSDSE